jgi:hypothetical protein
VTQSASAHARAHEPDQKVARSLGRYSREKERDGLPVDLREALQLNDVHPSFARLAFRNVRLRLAEEVSHLYLGEVRLTTSFPELSKELAVPGGAGWADHPNQVRDTGPRGGSNGMLYPLVGYPRTG